MTGPEHIERAQQTIAAIDEYVADAGRTEEGADPTTIAAWTQVAMVHLKAAEVAAAVMNGEATQHRDSWRKAIGDA